MINKLRAIDDKIIDVLQDAYLWLYDWTGVYLATCCVALILIGEVTRHPSSFELAMDGVLVLLFSPNYLKQMYGMRTLMNAQARWFRYHGFRYFYLAIMAAFVVAPPYDGQTVRTICGCVAIGFLQCIQIRERNRKDVFAWLRQPKTVGAAA